MMTLLNQLRLKRGRTTKKKPHIMDKPMETTKVNNGKKLVKKKVDILD